MWAALSALALRFSVLEPPLVDAEQARKLPTVIYSHGMLANRSCYSTPCSKNPSCPSLSLSSLSLSLSLSLYSQGLCVQ